MNFGKKGTINKQKQIKSTSKKLLTKGGVIFLRTFLVCMVVSIIIGSFAALGIVKGLIDNAPSIDSINVAPTGFSTTIYDQDGNELIKLAGSDANRIYADIDKIPKVLQDAFIAIEDERFYEHNGIDVQGIFRAFFSGLSSGGFSEGASTLTQQLLKNQVFEGGNEEDFISKLERKVQEQYLAVQLEDKLDKKQILEYYLNTINLGQNTLGVQAASLRYFNKDVSNLTLSEAAVIAGITNSPANLNPITFPDNNAKRRERILNNMLVQGYISEAEKEIALKDNVYERIQTVNEEQSNTSVYSYFIDELITQIVEDLQSEKGYSQTQAYNAIYRSGLSIYTTQDTSIQDICDDVFSKGDYFPTDSTWELTYRLSIQKKDETIENYAEGHLKNYFQASNPRFSLLFKDKDDVNEYISKFKASVIETGDKITGEKISLTIQPQASFVIMEQSTGEVKAIIGGRGVKEGNLTLNRASSTARQPGSTFKILSTYLPAIDSSGMTLATVIDDAPYAYPDGTPVKNWTSKFNGLTTLRQAIYNSMNVVTVKTLSQITPIVGYDYLLKLGFTTIVDNKVDESGKSFSDIGLPMALGGLTDGVTNLESTAAFAAIANNGIYTKPIFYTKIIDHDGKVLIDKKPYTRQVMKESTAWLLTNAMEDVIKKGTGTRLRFQNISMPIAGKTGTTTNNNDLWFSGYTPYYTATIWSGYDNNGKIINTNFHKNIWRDIMEKVNLEKEIVSFTMPDSIVTAKICTKSGKLAIEGICDHALGGSTVRTEYFAKGTVPTEKCNVHQKFNICSESNKLAGEFCPTTLLKEVIYLIKEKEAGTTADTPNILPKKLEESICNIHKTYEINLPDENSGLNGNNNNDLDIDNPLDSLPQVTIKPPKTPEPSNNPTPTPSLNPDGVITPTYVPTEEPNDPTSP